MKIIGILVLTGIFMAFFVAESQRHGIVPTLKAVTFSVAITVLIALGVFLITS